MREKAWVVRYERVLMEREVEGKRERGGKCTEKGGREEQYINIEAEKRGREERREEK